MALPSLGTQHYTSAMKKTLTILMIVLDHLCDAHLCANVAKCEFDKSKVQYLGYIISADGIKMNPQKLATIVDWPEPSSVKEFQSFLGFTNFYHHFIDHYAHICLPLNALTKEGTSFIFSDDACYSLNPTTMIQFWLYVIILPTMLTSPHAWSPSMLLDLLGCSLIEYFVIMDYLTPSFQTEDLFLFLNFGLNFLNFYRSK